LYFFNVNGNLLIFLNLTEESKLFGIEGGKAYKHYFDRIPQHRNPPIDFKLGVIIDCANMTQDISLEGTCKSINYTEWKTNYEHYKNTTYPIKNFELKAIVFRVMTADKENATLGVNIDNELALVVSKNFMVGCFYPHNLHKKISLTEEIVEVCKSINGSMYVLQAEVNLQTLDKISPYYYTNAVRKNLEEVKLTRELILEKHPSAIVYLHILFKTSLGEDQSNTVFCNQLVLQVNEFYDAILNWAKLSDIPVIMKYATDCLEDAPRASSWFSRLKIAGNDVTSAHLQPQLVIRNFPVESKQFLVDPCIEKTTGRDDIGGNFFQNDVIGSIMPIAFIDPHAHDPIDEAVETMLQFVLQKFQLLEIEVTSSYNSGAKILKQMAEKYIITPSKTIFMLNNNPLSIDQANHLLESIKNLKSHPDMVVVGVHANIISWFAKKLQKQDLSEAEKIFEPWKHFDEKRVEIGFDFGVLLTSEQCMVYFYGLFPFRGNMTRWFGEDYIVCQETISLFDQDDEKSLGYLFDKHLFLKKVFKVVSPEKSVYFRVLVEVALGESTETMDRYLGLLSNFKKFGGAYNTTYFMVQAFDVDNGRRNGWWSIKNYTDLTNAHTYVEKQSGWLILSCLLGFVSYLFSLFGIYFLQQFMANKCGIRRYLCGIIQPKNRLTTKGLHHKSLPLQFLQLH